MYYSIPLWILTDIYFIILLTFSFHVNYLVLIILKVNIYIFFVYRFFDTVIESLIYLIDWCRNLLFVLAILSESFIAVISLYL